MLLSAPCEACSFQEITINNVELMVGRIICCSSCHTRLQVCVEQISGAPAHFYLEAVGEPREVWELAPQEQIPLTVEELRRRESCNKGSTTRA